MSKEHKNMDRTSAAMAKALDKRREDNKKRASQRKFMKDRFGSTARGGYR